MTTFLGLKGLFSSVSNGRDITIELKGDASVVIGFNARRLAGKVFLF